MGKNDVNQIADNVRVVHAGCLIRPTKSCKFNILKFIGRADKRSASGNHTLVISDIPITLSMCWREERGKQTIAA